MRRDKYFPSVVIEEGEIEPGGPKGVGEAGEKRKDRSGGKKVFFTWTYGSLSHFIGFGLAGTVFSAAAASIRKCGLPAPQMKILSVCITSGKVSGDPLRPLGHVFRDPGNSVEVLPFHRDAMSHWGLNRHQARSSKHPLQGQLLRGRRQPFPRLGPEPAGAVSRHRGPSTENHRLL